MYFLSMSTVRKIVGKCMQSEIQKNFIRSVLPKMQLLEVIKFDWLTQTNDINKGGAF